MGEVLEPEEIVKEFEEKVVDDLISIKQDIQQIKEKTNAQIG